MAVLYDAYGNEVYAGGVTREDLIAAIQAAALADEFAVAEELADRHGWGTICLNCAIKQSVQLIYDKTNIGRRMCGTCAIERQGRDAQVYLQGLFRRNVR